jgi:glycerol uptake facilitator-like aquaporin
MGNGANLWIYWLSEFLGAAVAAVLFLVVNQEKLSAASSDKAQEQTDQSLRAV